MVPLVAELVVPPEVIQAEVLAEQQVAMSEVIVVDPVVAVAEVLAAVAVVDLVADREEDLVADLAAVVEEVVARHLMEAMYHLHPLVEHLV